MKKAIMYIAAFVGMVMSLTAFTVKPTAPGTGCSAPELSMKTDSSSISLDNFRGQYLLVSFWSSSEASSRIRCNEYTSAANQISGLNHIGINVDASTSLFNEVVKRDNLMKQAQYHVEGNEAALIKENYHLDRGLHSFLIDPQGTIVAVDPDKVTLNKLLI